MSVESQLEIISQQDREVADAMSLELKRQRDNIELIASENIVSEAVLAAVGSVLTNKYAEGYPGKRYYGGCQCVDIVENIADVKRSRRYDLTAPQGVRGRNSDNTLIKKELNWEPSISLQDGMEKTFKWIYDEVKPRYN